MQMSHGEQEVGLFISELSVEGGPARVFIGS